MATQPMTEDGSFEQQDPTQQQALALLALTAESLDWTIIYLSDAGLVVHPGPESGYEDAELVARFDGEELGLFVRTGNGLRRESPEDERMLQEFGNRYIQLRDSSSAAMLQERYDSFGALLSEVNEKRLLMPPPTARQKAADFFSMFRPSPGYLLTPLLVIANILVFIVMLLNGGDLLAPAGDFLISWGSNYTSLTLGGQWWRLLSSTFLHGGVIHLLMNMYALVSIGAMLEPRIGTLRFGVAYLISGIGGSLVSLWWHPIVNGVGASGAIFGMYGLFLAMLTTNLVEKNLRNTLLSSIGLFVGYNLLFGLKGNIDNAAHIGGLLTGALVGYAFYPSLRQPGRPALRNLSVGGTLLVAALASVIFARSLNGDVAAYLQGLETFTANEKRFQELLKDPALTNDAAYARIFRQSILLWEENLRLVKAGESISLPQEHRERNGLLVQYADLRLQELRLALDAASGKTGQDSLQMVIHKEVERVLGVLNKN